MNRDVLTLAVVATLIALLVVGGGTLIVGAGIIGLVIKGLGA